MGQLLGDVGRLEQMRKAARKMGCPHAAEVVVKTLLADSGSDPIEVNSDQQEEMAESVRKR